MSEKEKRTSIFSKLWDAYKQHQVNKLGICSYAMDDLRREAAKKKKK